MNNLSNGRHLGEGNFPRANFWWILRWLAVILALGFFLWWALRNVPFEDIVYVLAALKWSQIGWLLVINAAVIGLITARWWLIVRASNPRVPFLPMVGYRLAVFGLSYFTPGPQVGGEPLQVVYLQRNHKLTFARSTASVIMDKLVEFLVNFLLLSGGFFAVLETGILSEGEGISIFGLIGIGILLTWPLVHLVFLYNRILPISALLKALPFLAKNAKPVRMVIVSERMASRFCRNHTGSLFGAIGVSILAVAGIMAEYMLMARFLGVNLDLIEMFAALTFLQLAFLVPLPGGLGAMEASQVFIFSVVGEPAAAAISLTLLQRGRDILNGGLGLLLTGRDLSNRARLFRTSRRG